MRIVFNHDGEKETQINNRYAVEFLNTLNLVNKLKIKGIDYEVGDKIFDVENDTIYIDLKKEVF